MNNILITGSRGFLASSFINSGQEDLITCIGRERPMNLKSEVVFFKNEEISSIENEFKTIFHLSAKIPDNKTGNKELFEANVMLTKTLIENLKFNKFIFSSSVSVFGNNSDNILNEKSMGSYIKPYGLSKLWAESIVKELDNYAIIRFSSLYGRGMKETTLIPNFVNQALSKGVISVWGNGSRKQNYLHVDDAISLLKSASNSDYSGIFLGTYFEEYSNLEVAEIISELTGSKIEFVNRDDSKSYRYNNDFTREKLNWSPKIKIKEGIKDYIEWKRKQ